MVTVRAGGALRHLVVQTSGSPTVGALHDALGLSPPPPGTAGRPLRHGYAVPAPAEDAPPGAARLVVAAGPDAGGSVRLRHGRWLTVGRSRSCDLVVDDPALSRTHLRVRLDRHGVEVEDLASTNGLCWEAGPPRPPAADVPGRVPWPSGAALRAGSSRLELLLEPLPPLDVTDLDGRVEVRPWPRPAPEHRAVRLVTPSPPAPPDVRRPSAWSWALPLVASVLVAALLRMPMILLFGLMAPAMVLGQSLGDRRAARAEHRRSLRRHAQDLEDLEEARRDALRRDLQDRRRRDPGLLGPSLAWHGGPTTALWSRADEAPTVVLGEGRTPADVELDGVPLAHEAGPVTLALQDQVALVGPPALTAAAARGWLLQLATAQPPSRLCLVVDPADPPDAEWDLLAWLPHTRDRPDPAATNLVWGRGILLCSGSRDVPPDVTQVVLTSATAATLRRPGSPDVPFRPSLLALPLARHLARSLAPLMVDRSAAEVSGPTTLGDLAGWPADEAAVRAAWSHEAPRLRVPVGTDPAGAPVEIDLAADGPHALVAGTTGSGKSELLRALVTALALRNRPSALSLLLVDYKGGSSLGECAALPHSSGLVTDLDPHLAERVLRSLAGELRRREALLAAAGARDVREHGGDGLPRLVVVIDEFRVLAEELPDFLGGLVRLAAVGRSLGVHLVLATQRPAGVVSADLRANVNLRIALRVRDRADSLDVLEVPAAAELPEGRPGLALMRTGAGAPRPVQVAPVGPPSGAAATGHAAGAGPPRVEEVPGVWEGRARLGAQEPVATSGLGDLSARLAEVARDHGERPLTVWLPPLPDQVSSDGTPGAWALADRPEVQAQEPLRWDAATHVAVVGAARTGRTTAVRALLAAAGPCWLYVVDLGRGLGGTEVVDHAGLRAWVGPHDPAHGLRVLEVVGELVDARSGGAPGAHPPVVLVVDGWDRFLDAYRDVAGGRARELVMRILRDGPGTGVVVLLTGDRSLLSGAVLAEVPDVWALRLHDPADLLMTGLRRHQVPSHQPPGRVVRTRDGLVAQVTLPPGGGAPGPAASAGAPPRVVPLPDRPRDVEGWAVGGDDAAPVAPPDGPVLVLGPPGSGVSTTLAALAAVRTVPTLRVGPDDLRPAPGVSAPAGEGDLAARLQDFSGTVVVDDAHLLAGTRVEDLLLGWATRTGGDLIVGGELDACSSLFRGLVPEVARSRTGVVLQPDQPGRGAVLGVRLPVHDRRVPGRGVLVRRGRCTRVQVVVSDPRGAP